MLIFTLFCKLIRQIILKFVEYIKDNVLYPHKH